MDKPIVVRSSRDRLDPQMIVKCKVKVGDRSVIGARNLVTKDMPTGVLAAGNLCRVIREIEE